MSDLVFHLVSADPARLALFYRDALGFVPEGEDRISAAPYGVVGEATLVRLRLGAQNIALVGFDQPGMRYPADSTSHDNRFQHLALVASDIDAAHARLCSASRHEWRPITRGDGPVQLPASSGGVRAFKFRDPEGHPLELLGFPADRTPPYWSGGVPVDGALLGVDHSAIVVTDLARSLAFYAGHGFDVSAQSENTGPEQDALDGANGVRVSVRALSRNGATPHLELLAYHAPAVRPGGAAPADVACTRTVIASAGGQSVDPDGHALLV